MAFGNTKVSALLILMTGLACGNPPARVSRLTPASQAADSAQEFVMTLPPGFTLKWQGGLDSRARVWRRGTDSVAADWGPVGTVASIPLKNTFGWNEWVVRDTVLSGRPAQLATYRLASGNYGLDAVWPDLGLHQWDSIKFTAMLWINAATASSQDREAVIESLGRITFR